MNRVNADAQQKLRRDPPGAGVAIAAEVSPAATRITPFRGCSLHGSACRWDCSLLGNERGRPSAGIVKLCHAADPSASQSLQTAQYSIPVQSCTRQLLPSSRCGSVSHPIPDGTVFSNSSVVVSSLQAVKTKQRVRHPPRKAEQRSTLSLVARTRPDSVPGMKDA